MKKFLLASCLFFGAALLVSADSTTTTTDEKKNDPKELRHVDYSKKQLVKQIVLKKPSAGVAKKVERVK